MRWRGKVVVVTGASSGVGRAIAVAFGRRGARVGLIARGLDGLRAAAREVEEAGGEALVLPADVADARAVSFAAGTVLARWGRIDVWVNDAMLGVLGRAVDTTPDEYRRVTETTYLGYVHGTLAALGPMRQVNAGSIIQIGSALAYRSIPLQSAYCGAKAAVRGFTDSLRSELRHERSRVRVCLVQLPAVNTPQFDVMRHKQPGRPHPVPPIYEPEVVARAVVRIARRPPRELWIGASVWLAIVGQRLVPGLLDRYLAWRAWGAQTVAGPAPTRDNLEGPLPGDRGARGPFGREARRRSFVTWVRLNRGPILVGAAIAIAGLRRGARASA